MLNNQLQVPYLSTHELLLQLKDNFELVNLSSFSLKNANTLNDCSYEIIKELIKRQENKI